MLSHQAFLEISMEKIKEKILTSVRQKRRGPTGGHLVVHLSMTGLFINLVSDRTMKCRLNEHKEIGKGHEVEWLATYKLFRCESRLYNLTACTAACAPLLLLYPSCHGA